MTRKARIKTDPAVVAAQRRREDFERVGLQPEAAALVSNDDVVVEAAKRADVGKGERGNVERAQRTDVFTRLWRRDALTEAAYQAVRRLDVDMTERRGEGGRDQAEKVDGSGSRDLVSQRMIDAGRKVEDALRFVGRRDAAILVEMLEPRKVLAAQGSERWRLVVAVITGERHVNAQGALLKSACENLALSYREIDNSSRRAS